MKAIREMYKKMHKQQITTQQWWDFLETQDRAEIKQVVSRMTDIENRLRSFLQGEYFSNKVRQYANEYLYSDIHAYEVVRIVSAKCVEVRRMDATIVKRPSDFSAGGFCGHYSDNHAQEWEFKSDKSNEIIKIRLTKKGWKNGHRRFRMNDKPREFYDFNF
jgi:hypothetical protein